jgi:pyruvate/2-oxoglutarate dehydrogenase complex dihydrolipoamide acyltransferase (E2) component
VAGWDDKSVSREAVLINWFVRPGQSVAENQLLAEIMVEKVNLELTAPLAGIIREILVAEGAIVTPGAVLALLEEMDGSSPDAGTQTSEKERLQSSARRYVPASPAARRLARQYQLDLELVSQHLPPGKRLNEAMVRQFLVEQEQLVPSHRQRQSNLRKLIRNRVSKAFYQTAPVTLTSRADVTDLLEWLARQEPPVTLLAAVLRATALALREFPLLNAALDGEEVIYYLERNISLVVGVSKGIVLPVIRRVDELSLSEISEAVADLEQAACAGTLRLKDTQGGTFTVVDLGQHDIESFSPVLHQPQAAILGIGKVINEAVPLGETGWQWRKRLILNLTFDHCLADGSLAASCLQRIINYLKPAPSTPII